MNKQLRRTRLIGMLVLGGSLAMTWSLLLGPRFSQPGSIQSSADQTLNQKAMLDQQILSLERRQRYLPLAEREVSTLNARFPSVADVPSLLSQVNQAAGRAGMSANQIISVVTSQPVISQPAAPDPNAAKKPSDASQTAEMPVQIVASGSMSQLQSLLVNLRRMPRALAIDAITVSAEMNQANTATTGRFNLQVTARAFLMSPIAKVPDSLSKALKKVPVIQPAPAPTASAQPTAASTSTPTTSAAPAVSPTPAATKTP